MNTGERRLRNLGLFSNVRISPPDIEGIVRIMVKERWSLWLLPEVSRSDTGASSAGLTLTEYNMWGLNHRLRLAFEEDTGKNFSAVNGSSYQASYLWRRIGDTNTGLSLDLDTGRRGFDAYQNGVLTSQYDHDVLSWTMAVSYGFGPVPGEGLDVSLGFGLKNSNFLLLNGPPVASVQDQRRRSVSVSVNYSWLDDRITWITGRSISYSLSVAHSLLGSSINVYRQQASAVSHLALGKQRTLSLRLSGGLATGEVLLDGLFDIGNRNGLRGYFPGELQGTAYVFGTVEARIPVSSGGNFQAVAFIDAGQVWKDGSPALGDVIILGPGAGLRWTLRWLVRGTLRADAAYGVATRHWRFYFGTGQAF